MHARPLLVRLVAAIMATTSACSLTTSTEGLSEPGAATTFPAACSDGKKDGAETDVDCGGGACASCAIGKECDEGADCATGLCKSSRCWSATCSNGARDGTETDVDCGGGSCPDCPAKACWKDSDCTSGECSGFKCR